MLSAWSGPKRKMSPKKENVSSVDEITRLNFQKTIDTQVARLLLPY